MEKLRVASLFSGCGGIDLGILGGFEYRNKKYPRHPTEIVYAIDNDKYACNIFNKNFEVECIEKDVRDVNPDAIPAHDILTGGFPCQSFSIVAQNPPRLGYKDAKGRLFFEMVKILKEKKPKCFIAENVKGILSANKGKAFPMIIETFEEASYNITYKLLDSSNYGIPQNRLRVFIVGFKDQKVLEKFEFPKPTTSQKKVPLSEVVMPESQVGKKFYFSEKAVRGMERAKAKMNKGRVQSLTKPCNTISAHLAKYSLNSVDPVLKTNGKYRMFTPREAARIQSFPESFKLVGSNVRQYRAIGNAVPPVLMWHLTREIVKVLKPM